MSVCDRPLVLRPHYRAAIAQVAPEGAFGNPSRTLLFILLHMPLAILMRQSGAVATLHALATFAVGMRCATSGRQDRVAYAAAYITGAEVLWRMTSTRVPWELGKYAVAAILLTAIFRSRGRTPALPLLYFALLLPSVPLTWFSHDLSLEKARQEVSFNLSGPFALMMCAWFFSRLSLSREQVSRLLLILIAPIVGIAAIALFSTLSATGIQFTGESNFTTSGGFGPNQVSSALGLGAVCVFLWLLRERSSQRQRALMFALMLSFLSQGALTFSRGGLYNAAAAMLVAALLLSSDLRSGVRAALAAALLVAIATYIILPRLDAFTGGALANRFRDTTPTGRWEIMAADWLIFKENPVLGVGPGNSKPLHALTWRSIAAHTEFTRLLSEHGSFGLGALLLLLAASVRNWRRARAPVDRALVAALIVWTIAYMLSAAMRTVAPAFVFGLTFVAFRMEDSRKMPVLARPRFAGIQVRRHPYPRIGVP